MLFYNGYFTDLPDQFVEANFSHLSRWTDRWSDNPYLVQSRIIDGVQIGLVGKPSRDRWPTLKCTSQRMLELWMNNKGANYNGGYWGTLTADQRDPNRKSGAAWGGNSIFDPGALAAAAAATARRSSRWVGPGGLVWIGMDEAAPKPPLKRDGIIAGEIVGHRCWRIENGLLRSVYQTDVWRPCEVLAGRELGDWDSRGIHAWKDSGSQHYHDYIRSYLNRDTDMFVVMAMWGKAPAERPETRPAMVTGTVFLWGDVVEHERGYRAEYARVRSLDWLYPDATMMGREEESLNQLRAKYGVLS